MSEEAISEPVESESPVATETPAPAEATPNAAGGAGASAPVDGGGATVYHAFRNLPQFQGLDDRAIASQLYQSLQREAAATRALTQYQQIIPAAQEYLTHKEAFQRWQQSQAQPQQAPQPEPEEKKWWNPPQVRDAYRQYLVRDENGREVISADAPLDARHALVEYQNYKAEFAKKFLENPEDALGPMVQRVAEQRAAEIVQGQLDRYQQAQYVASLEDANKDWLYDSNGNVSQAGLAAQKYIEQAKAMGIQSPQARWDYSVAMVERDLLNQRYQQSQMAPPPQMQQPVQQQLPQPTPEQKSVAEKNMEFLRQQAARKPSQTTPQLTDPRVPKPARTFAQKLAQQLGSN